MFFDSSIFTYGTLCLIYYNTYVGLSGPAFIVF